MNWLDFIVSKRGQWDHPGELTAVPTDNGIITMKGVPYPVMGFVPGQPPVMMQPGKNYKFPGKTVYEIPVPQYIDRGWITPQRPSTAIKWPTVSSQSTARRYPNPMYFGYGGDISIPDLSRPAWLGKYQGKTESSQVKVKPTFLLPKEEQEKYLSSLQNREYSDPIDIILDVGSYSPGLVGMGASSIGFGKNLQEGDYKGAALDAANVLTAGAAKYFNWAKSAANSAGASRIARSMADKADFLEKASNPNIYKTIGLGRDLYNYPYPESESKYFTKEDDYNFAKPSTTDVKKPVLPVKPLILKGSGGDISIPDLYRPNWLDKAQKGQQVKYTIDPVKVQNYEDSLTVYNAFKYDKDKLNSFNTFDEAMRFVNDRMSKHPQILKSIKRLQSRPEGYEPIGRSYTKEFPVKGGSAAMVVEEFAKPKQPYRKYDPKEMLVKTPKLEREPVELIIPQSDRILDDYNNTRQVLRGIQEEDKFNQNLYPTRVVPAPDFRHGGWLDEYQGNTQSSQVKTYASDPNYFNSHAVLVDNSQANELVKSKIYAGTHGWDPTTNSLVKLDKPVAVPEAIREMATADYGKKNYKERFESNTPAGKEVRKAAVAQGMKDMVQNPLLYAPGAVAAGALAAPVIAGAAPAISGALSAPLTVGSTVIPGATIGNAISAGFAADAAINRFPQIPGQLSRGEYLDAAINAGTGALDLYGANMVSPLFKGVKAVKQLPGSPNVEAELDTIRRLLKKNVTHPKQTGPLPETPPWPNRFLHLSDDPRVIGNMERGRTSIPNPDVDLPGRLPKPTPKQLPGASTTFKSEIDWRNWVKNKEDFDDNPDVINELLNIERSTKADGTWMKNPDGSSFEGTPEEFVVQQSENFKKAYPQGYDTWYSGRMQDPTEQFPIMAKMRPEGLSIFGGDRNIANHYAPGSTNQIITPSDANQKGLFEFISPKSNNSITIDAEGSGWRSIPVDPKSGIIPLWEGKPVVDFEKRLSHPYRDASGNMQIGYKVKTDDIAAHIENKGMDYANIKNVFDGVNAEYVRIHNMKPGNYPKSLRGNILFDMSNPNIYKGLVPAAIAGALQKEKYGGWLDRYQVGSEVNCPDGNCRETDQIQAIYDNAQRIPERVADFELGVVENLWFDPSTKKEKKYLVIGKEGDDAREIWKQHGVDNFVAPSCMYTAGLGWRCAPETKDYMSNFNPTSFNSNTGFIDAVNKGTLPFNRVIESNQSDFDSQKAGNLRPGDIVNFKGSGVSHAMTFTGYDEKGNSKWFHSPGPPSVVDQTNLWKDLKSPEVKKYVNRFDVDRYVQEIYNDKIQELEKQARENPTYYKKGGIIPTDNQDYNYIKYKDLSLSRGTGWLDNYK